MVREQKLAQSMQGVSLRNVRATAFQGKAATVDAALTPACDYGRGEKKIPRPPIIESRFGEMLFTHFGLGGPIILLMSLAVVEALENGPVSILIDLKPALTKEQLRKRLQLDLNNFGKRKIASILKEYLPAKMIEPFVDLTGMDDSKTGASGQRRRAGKNDRFTQSVAFQCESAAAAGQGYRDGRRRRA